MNGRIRRKAKRRYSRLSEREIVEAVVSGRLRIDTRGNVYTVNGHTRQLVTYRDPQGRDCVRIYLRGARRGLTVARLVWMADHLDVPPADSHVDHINMDKHDNRPANLRLLSASENSARNRRYDEQYGEF